MLPEIVAPGVDDRKGATSPHSGRGMASGRIGARDFHMAETKLTETDSEALYERDFYRWTETMAARLRDREAAALDWDNLAEEIESLGGRDRRELKNRLQVLIAHLLKWQYQPERREMSTWKATIREQRNQIADLLEQSPSLKPKVREFWAKVYRRAVDDAADDMHVVKSKLPKTCPYTETQVLNQGFYPE